MRHPRLLKSLFDPSGSAPAAPATAAPVPVEILARYPGPALHVAPGGALLGHSPAAAALAAARHLGTWYPTLTEWLAALSPEALPSRVSRIRQDNSESVVDWTAVRLADGSVLLTGRDITLEHNLRQALVESRQRFRDMVDIAGDFAWETDGNGEFRYVSPDGALGHAATALVGASASMLLDEPDALARSIFETRRVVRGVETWLRRANGESACIIAWARPLFDSAGSWYGARGICREVTEMRAAEVALARARTRERLIAHIVQAMRDAVEPVRALDVAVEAMVHALAANGSRLYRLRKDGRFAPPAAFTQDPAAGFEPPDGPAAIALTAESAGPVEEMRPGQHLLVIGTRYRQAVNGALVVWRAAARGPWQEDDVALLQAAADQLGIAIANVAYYEDLKRHAECDALTGLLNRRAFTQQLTERLEAGGAGALVYIDLDNFKAVNDLCGHQQGDAVLGRLSAILQDAIEGRDLAGRMGGDEFVLWLDGADAARASGVAAALIEAGRAMATLSAAPDRPLGLSAGVALRRAGSTLTLPQLIAQADGAMYQAKAAGKSAKAGGGWALGSGSEQSVP